MKTLFLFIALILCNNCYAGSDTTEGSHIFYMNFYKDDKVCNEKEFEFYYLNTKGEPVLIQYNIINDSIKQYYWKEYMKGGKNVFVVKFENQTVKIGGLILDTSIYILELGIIHKIHSLKPAYSRRELKKMNATERMISETMYDSPRQRITIRFFQKQKEDNLFYIKPVSNQIIERPYYYHFY